jgi:hypothetical protein
LEGCTDVLGDYADDVEEELFDRDNDDGALIEGCMNCTGGIAGEGNMDDDEEPDGN